MINIFRSFIPRSGTSRSSAPAEKMHAEDPPVSPIRAFKSATFSGKVPTDLAFPDRKGIPHDSAEVLMQSYRALVLQAVQTFQGTHQLEHFEDMILDMIYRFACHVGTLPASRTYHHEFRGGLFAHSLAVAVSSLHMATGKNVVSESSPRDREAHTLAWQIAVFSCGLLHDAGKVHTLGRVQAMGVRQEEVEGFVPSSAPAYDTIWYPSVESFENWAHFNRVESYFIDYEHAEVRPHTGYSERYLSRIVPAGLLAFIYKSNPHVARMFEDFVRNPQSSANTVLFKLIHDADHVNVSEALNPRKKPGAMNISGLLWRRLSEFSEESVWNLPTSPFIRAFVQIDGQTPRKFVQLPFFVATPDNIEKLVVYVMENEKFGVSFGDKSEQIIFGTLEQSMHFNRSVDGILPNQIPTEELPEHIPASVAHVMFTPRRTEHTVVHGPADDAPIILDLPVIPLGGMISFGKTEGMPTLSFTQQPGYPMTDSLRVSLVGGKLKPEDPAQELDADHARRLDEIITSNDLGAAEANQLRELGRPKDVGLYVLPDQLPPTRGGKREGRSVVSKLKGSSAMKDAKQSQKSGETRSEPESTVAAEDAPLWLRLYLNADEEPEVALIASVWVFFTEQEPQYSVMVGDGMYAFKSRSMGPRMREIYAKAIVHEAADISRLSSIWPPMGLFAESDVCKRYLQLRGNSKLLLTPPVADLLEAVGATGPLVKLTGPEGGQS